jgi:hypothetical protein
MAKVKKIRYVDVATGNAIDLGQYRRYTFTENEPHIRNGADFYVDVIPVTKQEFDKTSKDWKDDVKNLFLVGARKPYAEQIKSRIMSGLIRWGPTAAAIIGPLVAGGLKGLIEHGFNGNITDYLKVALTDNGTIHYPDGTNVAVDINKEISTPYLSAALGIITAPLNAAKNWYVQRKALKAEQDVIIEEAAKKPSTLEQTVGDTKLIAESAYISADQAQQAAESLQTDVTALKTDITYIKGKVDKIKEVKGTKGTKGYTSKDIEKIEEDLDTLKTTLARTEGKVDGVLNKYNIISGKPAKRDSKKKAGSTK